MTDAKVVKVEGDTNSATVFVEIPGSPNTSKINDIIKDKVTEAVKSCSDPNSLPKIVQSVVIKLSETKDPDALAKAKRDDAFSQLEKTTEYYLNAGKIFDFLHKIKSVKIKTAIFNYFDAVLRAEHPILKEHSKTFDSFGETDINSDQLKTQLADILIDIMFVIPEFIPNLEKIMGLIK